jgi:hypothetical protein
MNYLSGHVECQQECSRTSMRNQASASTMAAGFELEVAARTDLSQQVDVSSTLI